MQTITITWDENRDTGCGELTARNERGCVLGIVDHEEPINSGSDSHAIADLFDLGAVVAVDHDGQYVHVTVRDQGRENAKLIRNIKHENSIIYFVADDLGMPVSYGYLTEKQAEEVAELIESSEGMAPIPQGIDVAAILADHR